jgi:8-oxo-dGTP pyrophosphatase MutT (NUDIX family)
MPAIDRIEGLEFYKTTYEDELPYLARFCDLLESERCFHRDHLPGHITGSAWILNKKRTHVLLVHHVKLNRWLQPGGHADGEENVLSVALREVNEETGLVHFKELVPGIFDLDIHTIPARNEFPEHLHYDVRFAFVATDDEEDLAVSEESHEVKWISLLDVAELCCNNGSILRMLMKTNAIKI